MSHRVAGRLVVILCLVACMTVTVVGAAEERPTKRISPAPKVNPNAVVWRTPAPPTNPQAGDVWVNPKDAMAMVYVAAGEFTLGTSDAQIDAWLKQHPDDERDWFRDEQPQRQVHLDGYWVDKCLVTVAQYRKFCESAGRNMPLMPSWGWRDDHPIVNVTWNDALAYAQWAGKRLPTEAEWEKAARGSDGRQYPWGNEWDASKCAHSVNAQLGSTKPVGSYPAGASPYGCLDMAGNVCEWCADWYEPDYYRTGPDRNPKGPGSGELRVLRGGSWDYDDTRYFRCACRDHYPPRHRLVVIGFRCARGLP
jgi:formylglycine-generating enzyme required for sulfatase activity